MQAAQEVCLVRGVQEVCLVPPRLPSRRRLPSQLPSPAPRIPFRRLPLPLPLSPLRRRALHYRRLGGRFRVALVSEKFQSQVARPVPLPYARAQARGAPSGGRPPAARERSTAERTWFVR